MKYVVVQLWNTHCKVIEQATLEEALQTAEKEYSNLSLEQLQEMTSFYVLESSDPNPDSDLHFDGNIIQSYL